MAGFIIDCQDGDIGQAATFWSQAIGLGVTDPDEYDDGRYAVLETLRGDLRVEVQRVSHASRVHLDIESDDIEAEVARLIALGATEVSRPHDGRWVVMQAPTGHRFCVIRPKVRLTLANANRWG
ncbi:MAG: VOC family protein [Arenimonas sp.]|nr:VOC family protein [Arenimonas sp.]